MVLVTVGCTGGSTGAPATPTAGGTTSTTRSTPVELAPSQRARVTVVAPEIPGPCRRIDLVWSTAQVRFGENTVTPLLRVINIGDARCELDVGGTAEINPDLETSVWLDPGGLASLVIGPGGGACRAARLDTEVRLDVGGGDGVVVPTVVIGECGWQLDALYGEPAAVDRCEQANLGWGLTPGRSWLVIANTSPRPCRGGGVVLAAGDVVAWRVADQVTDCSAGPYELTLGGDLTVVGDGPEACVRIADDTASAVFGAAPSEQALTAGSIEAVVAALEALVPAAG